MQRNILKQASQRRKKLKDALSFAGNITEQMRMAGAVQKDFLPKGFPNVKGFKWSSVFIPYEWVSGDVYDVQRIDEEHIGFYTADVVGHGVPAALLTIFITQALAMRETVGKHYKIFSPAEVMNHLNERMTELKLSGNQFATCCYGLLNTKTKELTYSRAGHPYPVVIKENNDVKTLQAKGALLGIFENTEYDQQTIPLESGDRLLLYSDGAEPFIGSSTPDGKFNFTEQFKGMLNLNINALTEKFETYARKIQKESDSEQYKDDITLLCLKVD
jgi:sigma-B regulation protein RsbU (phosphoserine phosphatase)